ncbi:jg14471 [Pararge aegeria aegeria]|uniref:Jg14471 protein n=1 Tax=Pararge aegeria aegeria TaxID=348720 RepID=A0A8S4RWU0_9NEOP|nr:jg14471 [Pararge aegeria aegeria]
MCRGDQRCSRGGLRAQRGRAYQCKLASAHQPAARKRLNVQEVTWQASGVVWRDASQVLGSRSIGACEHRGTQAVDELIQAFHAQVPGDDLVPYEAWCSRDSAER